MQIHFFSREGWLENKFHFHDQMDMVLTMSDGGYFYIRNKVYPITRGSLFILNPDDLHCSRPQSDSLYQFYSTRFYSEDIAGFSTPEFDILGCFQNHEQFNHRVQLSGDQLDHLLRLINKMEYYLNDDCSAYGKQVLIKTLLAETLVYVNFLYDMPSRPVPPSGEEVSKLQPVITYINEHISEELSLDILSKQLFVNKYYLSHRFKDVMGFTLSEYIIQRRLYHAKLLLRQGSSVTLAGERSGFNSSAHFIRTFVKFVGISPKQYAKQYPKLDSYESSWMYSPFPRRKDNESKEI